MSVMLRKGFRRVVVSSLMLVGIGACNAILGNDDITFVAADGATPPSDAGTDGETQANAPDACPTDLQTNAEHCGRCGRSCEGALCRDGMCEAQRIAQGYGMVRKVAVDVDGVYFTSSDQWLLGRMAKDGGALALLQPEGGIRVPSSGLVPDGPYVYASAFYGDGVRRVPKAGGAAEKIEQCNTTLGVATDATDVYWFLSLCGGDVRMRRRTKNVLDALATVESMPASALGHSQDTAGCVAIDDTHVYWSNDAQILRLPKVFLANATPEVVYDRPDASTELIRGIAVADRVYALAGDRVIALPKNGGASVVLADAPSSSTSSAAAIAVADGEVYFTRPESGIVGRVRATGGPVETLAKGQAAPTGVAIDAQYIYWSNAGDGSIWRLAR